MLADLTQVLPWFISYDLFDIVTIYVELECEWAS